MNTQVHGKAKVLELFRKRTFGGDQEDKSPGSSVIAERARLKAARSVAFFKVMADQAYLSERRRSQTTKGQLREEIQANTKNPKKRARLHIRIDDQMTAGLNELQSRIERFASEFHGYDTAATKDCATLKKLAFQVNPEFVNIVENIAVGGSRGLLGWDEIFRIKELRVALVRGVIGLVLKEHVFNTSLFGATSEQEHGLNMVEKQGRDHDGNRPAVERYYSVTDRFSGFVRSARRAELIPHCLNNKGLTQHFETSAINISMMVYTLLEPLFQASNDHEEPPRPDFSGISSKGIDELLPQAYAESLNNKRMNPPGQLALISMLRQLYDIVTLAGDIHIEMRKYRTHTIYYFEPTLKKGNISPESMKVLNRDELAQGKPLDKAHPGDTEDSTSANIHFVPAPRAQTRIVCFDGVVAYRKGGFRRKDNDKGLRSRRIANAVVWGRWGKQRGLGKDQRDKSFVGCVKELNPDFIPYA